MCALSFSRESGFFLSLLDFFFTCFLVFFFFLSLFSFSSCCVLNCLTSTAIHGNCLHAPASLRCGEYWSSVEGDVFWDELHIQLFLFVSCQSELCSIGSFLWESLHSTCLIASGFCWWSRGWRGEKREFVGQQGLSCCSPFVVGATFFLFSDSKHG